DAEPPRPFTIRKPTKIHRIKNKELVDVFLRTRKDIELAAEATGHIARIHKTIRETCGKDIGITGYSTLAEFLTSMTDTSALVLFRRRADVLFASSYCSEAAISHRLRSSEAPIVVRPWVGWLFGETAQALISKDDFDNLWDARAALAPSAFEGEHRDTAWG